MLVDYDEAHRLLNETFGRAEQDLLAGRTPEMEEELAEAFETVFESRTQAYREVLVGCVLARIQDKSLNMSYNQKLWMSL